MTVTEWLLERMSELTFLDISLILPTYDSTDVAVLIRAQAVGNDFTILADVSNLKDINSLEKLADLLRFTIGDAE